MAPMELKSGFQRQYDNVKAHWGKVGDQRTMKENFDALIDHLMATGFFLEQAVEILEKGMIERALPADEFESVRSRQAARHSPQYAAAQNGGAYDIDGKRPRRKPVTQRDRARLKTHAGPQT